MKKKSITSKELRAELNQSYFNPNQLGPLNVIVEIGEPAYLEARAIEFINEAKKYIISQYVSLNSQQFENYDQLMTKAISLLALAKAKRRKQFKESTNKIDKKEN